MWVRKKLDIGWADLARGAWCGCLPSSRGSAQRKVEEAWSSSGEILACLSVRSGWDLLLSELDWPPGSEIAMSALTIPDMARIAEHHGLTPVPVDIDLNTAGPNLDSLRRSITSSTRAVLVAHLFGAQIPMAPIIAIAREHGLLVIEDCAQAYDGGKYQGHPETGAALFSFGPIKTATAVGGAVLRVRDAELLEKMRRRQEAYPVQARAQFMARLAKYSLLKAISSRPTFAAFVRCASAAGFDCDRLVNGSVRGFPGSAFFERIRQQPSAPLLALLLRRLRRFDRRRLEQRSRLGERLCRLLEHSTFCPGACAANHTHWVFPILASDPAGVIAALREAGFDATQGHSMAVIPAPADRRELTPHCAMEALARIVYLPVYPEMPERELERMAKVVLRVAGQSALDRGDGVAGLGGRGLGDDRKRLALNGSASSVGVRR
jgi:perosamine synthetase